MASTVLTERALKRALKEVLVETLQEQHELLRNVFADVLEDFALGEAIREGQKSKHVERESLMRTLQGKK